MFHEDRERDMNTFILFLEVSWICIKRKEEVFVTVNSGAYKTIWSGFAVQSYIFVGDNSLYCGDKGKEEEVALFYAFVLNLLYFLGPF